jgi:ribosomal protein L12E/L44/L45/RPP1/RPP2
LKNLIIAQEDAAVSASEKQDIRSAHLENDNKINDTFSWDSNQEEFSFNISESEGRFVNSYRNSADNVFTNPEAAHSSKIDHLHDMSFILEKLTDKDLLSALIHTSNTKTTIHTTLANAKKATELKPSQENSDTSKEEEEEEEEEEVNLSVQCGIKDMRENKMSANENNINNDTRKVICLESELNSILESEEEIKRLRKKMNLRALVFYQAAVTPVSVIHQSIKIHHMEK